jgi:hypothetical protein
MGLDLGATQVLLDADLLAQRERGSGPGWSPSGPLIPNAVEHGLSSARFETTTHLRPPPRGGLCHHTQNNPQWTQTRSKASGEPI